MYIDTLKYFLTLGVGISDLPNQKTDWSLIGNMLGQFFFLFVICGLVIYFAYFITKKVGQARFSGSKGANLSMVESMFVGYGQAIHIVKAGNKYVLIGVTKEKVSYLTDIDPESISINEIKQIDLRSYLKKKNISIK